MSDAAPNTTTPTLAPYSFAEAIRDLEKLTCVKGGCDYCLDRHQRVLSFVRALAAAPSSPPSLGGAERAVIEAAIRWSERDYGHSREYEADAELLDAVRSLLSAPAAAAPAGSEAAGPITKRHEQAGKGR